jgi:hypothetical protein
LSPILFLSAVTTTGETGAAEVEIWPGAPGTQTLKILISANNTDITTTAGTYNDFVGGMLFAGRPGVSPFATLGVTRRNETGAAEVEIWPGAPGTQTLKILISSNNTDITTTS